MRTLSISLKSLQTHAQQRGQAVAEMLIASTFLLVPLLLIMTLLMKYIDMASTVQQAARYAAFQRTIFMSNNSLRGAAVATRSNVQIENAVRMRFFSAGVNDINNGQNQGTATFAALSLWKDTTNQPMVAAASAASLGLTDDSSPSKPDQTVGTILKPLQSLGVGFNLNFNGLMTANISLKPNPPNGNLGYDNLATPSLYAALLGTLVFSAHDTVLADGWSAANPANVKHQIDSVLPTSIFSSLNRKLKIAAYLIPDIKGLDLGHVLINTPIEVPADRLANYKPSPPGGVSKAQSTMIAQLKKQYTSMSYNSSTQTKNSNGSITLSFTQGGTVIRQIVKLDGSTSAPISTTLKYSSNGVVNATLNQIAGLGKKKFVVDKNYPTYICAVKKIGKKTYIYKGPCIPSDIFNMKSKYYKGTVISSKTILHKITKYPGGGKKPITITTQAVLTVKLTSGGSDIKIVISS